MIGPDLAFLVVASLAGWNVGALVVKIQRGDDPRVEGILVAILVPLAIAIKVGSA